MYVHKCACVFNIYYFSSCFFQMDLKFVDVHGLSDDDKNKLLAILKSDTLKLPCDVIESNANSMTEVSEVSELHWYNGKILFMCYKLLDQFYSAFFILFL